MASGTIPAPAVPLAGEAEISEYLLSVVSQLCTITSADEVAVYLVDPATRRMDFRAWATGTEKGSTTDSKAPHELTDHGMEGDNLSVETL